MYWVVHAVTTALCKASVMYWVVHAVTTALCKASVMYWVVHAVTSALCKASVMYSVPPFSLFHLFFLTFMDNVSMGAEFFKFLLKYNRPSGLYSKGAFLKMLV